MADRYAGPDSGMMQRALELLADDHDDRSVTARLRRTGRLAVDAASGEPVGCWHYRLECGHLIAIWHSPLPESTRHLYCGDCSRDRLVVERLS